MSVYRPLSLPLYGLPLSPLLPLRRASKYFVKLSTEQTLHHRLISANRQVTSRPYTLFRSALFILATLLSRAVCQVVTLDTLPRDSVVVLPFRAPTLTHKLYKFVMFQC